ncbi:unnamed protein product [Pleuronectes platessa]|uniref:Uncharacterized protein n=1 Tax=Pleuronectes platessa TaxID=8262 RepID=A0A9N7YPS9_PLEPL|nr:unnamed protein product [Pleuronectes platessa]
MAAPQRNAEKVIRSSEHMDSFRRSLDKLLSLSTEDGTETEMLRSRINEQSSMICILKQRADELTLQCQALQKINTEQGDGVTDHQRELDKLRLKLQTDEEKNTAQEINMKKRTTRLIKEKEELLSLSIERGRVIQEKQEAIQQLERKWKKEKKSRTEAEDKFEQDAETVNADVKVQSLKCALNDSATKYQRLQKDFDAFREHSASLLTQERELNKKLRHMIG